ncbi:uncharacterized protein [Palaemon carinicauda]|uniref:uncharacterized protein n=1 Tax=Palaemon carinicauda TaxID=392227 RepID=UPI0035B5D07E
MIRLQLYRAKYKVQRATTEDTGIRKLKAMIGILGMSGLKNENHVSDAQMFTPFEGGSLYRSTMSNARFAFLMRVLRIDNLQTRTHRILVDRLAPIRTLWHSFVDACKNIYVPGPHLIIDEQLVPFRGKTPLKMYILNKPAKTHGEFYIMELIAPYPRRGRVVTTDNGFSSLQAAESLKKNSLDFVGTIKDKPYLPKPLFTMKIKVGESIVMYHNEKTVTPISHQTSKAKRHAFISKHSNLTILRPIDSNSMEPTIYIVLMVFPYNNSTSNPYTINRTIAVHVNNVIFW